jgi:PadR family transcriptional regulator, regulatory protein PadR
MQDMELTLKSARVIGVFLEDPRRPRYGFDLMRQTGFSSGTLYPMLARFERAGWLAGRREDINPVAAGRPARRAYVMTEEAVPVARAKLAAIGAEFTRGAG